MHRNCVIRNSISRKVQLLLSLLTLFAGRDNKCLHNFISRRYKWSFTLKKQVLVVDKNYQKLRTTAAQPAQFMVWQEIKRKHTNVPRFISSGSPYHNFTNLLISFFEKLPRINVKVQV